MNIETITIEQMMKLEFITETFKDREDLLTKEVVKLFHGHVEVPLEEGEETMRQVKEMLLNTPQMEEYSLVRRFEFNGKEWGMIPNLKNIKTNEYIDLDYWVRQGNSPHKVMAVLYRPIINSGGDLYEIEPYNGTEKYSEELKGVDWKVYKGGLIFFYHLRTSLLNAITIYIQREKKKTLRWMKIKQVMMYLKNLFKKDSI